MPISSLVCTTVKVPSLLSQSVLSGYRQSIKNQQMPRERTVVSAQEPGQTKVTALIILFLFKMNGGARVSWSNAKQKGVDWTCTGPISWQLWIRAVGKPRQLVPKWTLSKERYNMFHLTDWSLVWRRLCLLMEEIFSFSPIYRGLKAS